MARRVMLRTSDEVDASNADSIEFPRVSESTGTACGRVLVRDSTGRRGEGGDVDGDGKDVKDEKVGRLRMDGEGMILLLQLESMDIPNEKWIWGCNAKNGPCRRAVEVVEYRTYDMQ